MAGSAGGDLDFSTLSLKDLIEARDLYHFHLMSKATAQRARTNRRRHRQASRLVINLPERTIRYQSLALGAKGNEVQVAFCLIHFRQKLACSPFRRTQRGGRRTARSADRWVSRRGLTDVTFRHQGKSHEHQVSEQRVAKSCPQRGSAGGQRRGGFVQRLDGLRRALDLCRLNMQQRFRRSPGCGIAPCHHHARSLGAGPAQGRPSAAGEMAQCDRSYGRNDILRSRRRYAAAAE